MWFKKAVLIIHGFGGSMWETEYLLNYLEFNTNYDVYSFTLPGHEKAIVKGVKCEEWIKASEEKLEMLIKKYSTVYVIGHSMGGVLASHLASKYRQVKKLVLLAPAFIYGNFDQNKLDFKNLMHGAKEYKEKYKEEIYPDLLSRIRRLPLATLLEFKKLVRDNYKCPEDIFCPILVMHGLEDEIVPISSSKYVYNSVKSRDKTLTLIKNTKHRILNGDRKEEVSKYISIFLKGGLLWTVSKKSEI